MSLKIFNGETTINESSGDREVAHQLLDDYVAEVKATHPKQLCTTVKPKEYKAGNALLETSPANQALIAVRAASLLVKELYVDSQRDFALHDLLKILFRKKLQFDDKSMAQLLRIVEQDALTMPNLPMGSMLACIEKHVSCHGLSTRIRTGLERLTSTYHPDASAAEERKYGVRITSLLDGDTSASVEIFDLNSGEAWTDALLVELGQLTEGQRALWQALFTHCRTAKASKPSKKWLKQAQALLDSLGPGPFVRVLCPALAALGQPGKSQRLNHGGFIHWSEPTQIHDTHVDLLRGLIWTTSLCFDGTLISHVGDAAEKCFHKVREVGPRCPKIGNACLVALSSTADPEAVAQLGRLRSRAKHASTRKQISRAFERAAEQAGMTEADLEEIAVPTFGLPEIGHYIEPLSDFTAVVEVNPHGKPSLGWIKADGKRQKSVPASVKTDFADELKVLKKKIKDIGTLMPSLRDRTERLFLAERSWSLGEFRKRFLDHPLVGVVARRLIWQLSSKADATAAGWNGSELVDAHDQAIQWLDDHVEVSIWHPLQAQDPSEVLQWRNWLESHGISQPFKQAHREVYLLTDAERDTQFYSSRFAAHIIRQHQFAALCQQRGWRYDLQGDWDSSNAPYLELPQFDLRAEYWVDPLDGFNEISQSFIYVHLGTDQVRFSRTESLTPLPLEEIPPLVFSEVMRDVDLFVGVTSVGNDPNWGEQTVGEPYHDYWERYSFGDLTQTAMTRKAVLERVVPQLKIADRCTFDDRFLVVQGQLRTYKIHLGSGNVLMSPNDQYLCIVQNSGSGSRQTSGIFLPFDGDNTLSLIISKAFLLADDDQITDLTILNQIKGPPTS